MFNVALNFASTNAQSIGIPPEQITELMRPWADLSETQKRLIEKLEVELEVNRTQIRAALDVLGEADVAVEALGSRLLEIVKRLKAQIALVHSQDSDSPSIDALKHEVEKALVAGELVRADALLAEIEVEQRAILDRSSLSAASTFAQRGELALTRLRYQEAATHYANASAAVAASSGNEETRIEYLLGEAYALFRQGHEQGDNNALLSVVKLVGPLVKERFANLTRQQRATSQNLVGLSLAELGQRQNDPTRLREATAALRAALTDIDRAREPIMWAEARHNLGTVLELSAEIGPDTSTLREAITVYRASLQAKRLIPEWDGWPQTRGNLGGALWMLGERERSLPHLRDAVRVLQMALNECSRESQPLMWAGIKNTLGTTLRSIGVRLRSTTKLEQSIMVLREALEERRRQRVPLEWATTMNNLGNALQTLGAREPTPAKLHEAIAAYHAALEERTRGRVPIRWAETMNNLGFALSRLGERETGTARLEEALEAFRMALQVRTPETLPLQWRETKTNMMTTEVLLSNRLQATC